MLVCYYRVAIFIPLYGIKVEVPPEVRIYIINHSLTRADAGFLKGGVHYRSPRK